VYYLYYKHTMQHRAMHLMSKKMAAALAFEGAFSEDALAAMAGDDEMQMALAKSMAEKIDQADMQRSWSNIKSGDKKKPRKEQAGLAERSRDAKPTPLGTLPIALSGDSGTVVLKKKHTRGLDLRKVVLPAIDLYLEKAGAFVLDIEMMKNIELSDAEAKAIIFDASAFERPVMNRRMLPELAYTYFRDERQREWFPDRSLWSLNNAFTQVVRALPVNRQNAANIAIGRAFARIVRRRRRPAHDVALDADLKLPSDT
jgi:hypothetical protein